MPLKKEEDKTWLNEVSNATLQTVMRDLEKSYEKFFAIKPARFSKKTLENAKRKKKKLTPYDLEGHSKFKSKKKAESKFPARGNIYFKNNIVTVEKIGKVVYQSNFDLPQGRDKKFLNPRIKYIEGKWILSFVIECENQIRQLTNKKMGIDLGIKDLAIIAYGNEQIKIANINKSKRVRNLEHKNVHLQRKASRKYRTNGNYNKTKAIDKTEAQIRNIYFRLSNIRRNYTHQATHKLIELLPMRVTMENLNVMGMMKNRHLSKAIQQQCFSEFIRQMKYKCEWNGIEFQQADRFYPSSKTCSQCGEIKKDLKLSDRVYICPVCGLSIDRDYNAALNLQRYESQNEGQSA